MVFNIYLFFSLANCTYDYLPMPFNKDSKTNAHICKSYDDNLCFFPKPFYTFGICENCNNLQDIAQHFHHRDPNALETGIFSKIILHIWDK